LHSFGEFGVPTSHIANFVNDAALPTSNILSRVTGGNPSNIFGTIQTTGFGAANLFLMNPAGILFGPNASLNVGGSVSFTTADYLRLADGARFNAIPGPSDSTVSSAPVAAFGFLGSHPGAITMQGGQLAVSEGQGIALVGGNIEITGGTLPNGTAQPARLTAPGGTISLASVSSPGEVATNSAAVPLTDSALNGFSSLGNISLSQGTSIDTSADSMGRIVIRGGQFTMEDASLKAVSVNGHNGGLATSHDSPAISITADTVALTNGTLITADTRGAAPAGDITFNVDALSAKGAGPIRIQVAPESLISGPDFSKTGVLIESTSRSSDVGAGKAGHITIHGINGPGSAARTVSLDDTIIHTRSFGGTAATLPGGITIAADALVLSDQVEIYTTTNGAAPAGNVALNVNQLRSNWNADGSFIQGRPVLIGSPTERPDHTAGPPGTVTISGPGAESTDPAQLVMLSNTEIDTFAVGGSSPIPAPIIITADTAALSNLTILVTTSGGAAPAPAGDIALNVNTLRVNVSPDGSPITTANRVYLNSPSGRLDNTAGPPGTVTISGPGPEATDAAQLVALYNAQMSTAVEGGTAALPPGTITITADTMTLSGRTEIFAFTTSPAPAGNIALNVNVLRANVNADGTLINDGRPRSLISSVGGGEKSTDGRAGTVTISGLGQESSDSAKLIALNNTEVGTTVRGGTAATIRATITMAADTLSLTNSPNINTDSSGGAPAGNMTFNVNSLTVDHGTKISSSTSGPGHGGTITINAGESITLNNGSSITASSTGPANAGNIVINAGNQFLSQNGSITTEGSQASGGNITLQAVESIRLVNSHLNTSVQGGPNTSGGNITIDPAVVTLQNSQVRAEAVQGRGGNISIIAGTFLSDPTSIVSASSQFGLSGTVNIQSPVSSLSNTLATLPQQPLQTQNLLQQRCAAQANGQMSSLVVAGRDSLPVEPGGWLMSPMALMPDVVPPPKLPLANGYALDALHQRPTIAEPWAEQLNSLPQRAFTDWAAGCRS
jgi:filamentous hemagglutinin family protein